MRRGRSVWGGRKAGGPPVGQNFIWHTRELLTSLAWRTRSINCMRLLEFLEIEHLAHGGAGNGSLLAPYSQLVTFGIGRRLVADAIQEAEAKGLVAVKRGGLKGRQMTEVSRFRLTYMWTKTQSNVLWDWQLPTDEWKSYKPEIGAPLDPPSVHHSELASVHHSELAPSQPLEKSNGAEVHLSEPPSISRAGGTTEPVARAKRATTKRRSKPARRSEPKPSFPNTLPTTGGRL